MVTLDLRKNLKAFYGAKPGQVEFIDIPDFQFLMIDGQGAPDGPRFHEGIQALYSLAYTLKFAFKKEGTDYPVMPLEGLWSSVGGTFDVEHPSNWLWTLMVMQPEVVASKHLEAAKAELTEKKHLPGLDHVRLERFHEGKAAQTLHVGPYASEGPTIELLHARLHEAGLLENGPHHEIYLGDPRRAAPEKLRTILRQPVR